MPACADSSATLSPACRGKGCGLSAKRCLGLALCVALNSLVLAFIPMDYSTPVFNDSAVYAKTRVIHLNEAFAEQATPGTYPHAEYDFIQFLSNACNVTQPGNLITSSVGIVAINQGINMSRSTGLQMGIQMDSALDSLVDAADYQDWDTLTTQEQNQWGNKQNYQAAKWNSLLDAYGLGNAHDRYIQGYTGSGGGNIEWTTEERNQLNKLGKITNNWITGLGNTIASIRAVETNPEVVLNYFPQSAGEGYDASQVQNWPSSLPNTFTLGSGNNIWLKYKYRTTDQGTTNTKDFNNNVYLIAVTMPMQDGRYNGYMYGGFSDEPFTANGSSASRVSVHGQSVYISTSSTQSSNFVEVTSNCPITYVNQWPTSSEWQELYYQVLYGDIAAGGAADVPELEGYPGQEQQTPTEMVYIPQSGITPDTQYRTLTEPYVPPAEENPFNPGNQTSTQPWQNETTNNLLHLTGINFQGLFPFCLLYDIQLLGNKIANSLVGSRTRANYTDITIPLDVPYLDHGEITFDLEPLHDLAVIIRPFLQILLATGLLFVTIRFWQGILMG